MGRLALLLMAGEFKIASLFDLLILSIESVTFEFFVSGKKKKGGSVNGLLITTRLLSTCLRLALKIFLYLSPQL